MTAAPVIEVRGLHFTYRGDPREVLAGVDLTVLPGRRVLVIGANGAGKTTLLRILAGKHMVDPDRVQQFGRVGNDRIGVPARRSGIVGAMVAILHGDAAHAGGARRLDVAQVIADVDAIARREP